jgi:hypothetical protein
MKFTTPCFVRVEDAEKRKQILEWAEIVGYIIESNYMTAPMIYTTRKTHIHNDFEYENEDRGIDCGTNIGLFKALAAMNDENDRDQWFIHRLGGNLLQSVTVNMEESFGFGMNCCFRKATAAEIVEYFKDKKS